MAIGRLWVKGPEPVMTSDELDGLVDAQTAAKIRQATPTKEASAMLVLEEHWPAVEFLGRLSGSCWKYLPMGGVAGFDYPQIESLMRLLKIKPAEKSTLFEQLQWIERGALDALNKK